ncbi:hypothetical protein BDY19DRAFT_972247, partial [Irpex rosettiformis]
MRLVSRDIQIFQVNNTRPWGRGRCIGVARPQASSRSGKEISVHISTGNRSQVKEQAMSRRAGIKKMCSDIV